MPVVGGFRRANPDQLSGASGHEPRLARESRSRAPTADDFTTGGMARENVLCWRSSAPGATPMPIHLEPGPDNVHWGYFDAALAPLLTVASGDTRDDLDRLRRSRARCRPRRSTCRRRSPPFTQNVPQQAARPHLHRAGRRERRQGRSGARGATSRTIELHYDWGYNMSARSPARCRTISPSADLMHIPLDRAAEDRPAAVGPGAAARAVLRRDGGGAAARLGHDLDAAAAPQRRQSRQQGAGRGHARSICRSSSTARCSRSATATACRATARSASPRSRPG